MPSDSPIKVSVIIPCYNVEKYLRECLDSVINQTLKEIEIICVDDGSTDSTPKILEEYAAKDSRFTILHQKNQFAGVARNNGMKIARGKYLSFLDSDDFFEPTMFEKMVRRAEDVDAEIVVCEFKHFFESNPKNNWIWRAGGSNRALREKYYFSGEDEFITLPTHSCSFVPWNKLFSHKFIKELKNQFSTTRSSNDLAFVSFALFNATRITIIPEALLSYRRESKGAISSTRGKFLETNIAAWEDLKNRLLEKKIYNKFRASFLDSLVGSVSYELKQNPSPEFLDAVYAKFPDVPYSSREAIEQEAFRKVISSLPLVSVVVPVYNKERYLRECLDSLLNQTLQEIEVICVDNESTDLSAEILYEYAKKDNRIIIARESKKGVCYARNTGILLAHGKYIGFVDADDYVDASLYEKLVLAATETNATIAKGNVKLVTKESVAEPSWSLNNFIRNNQEKLPLFSRFSYQFSTAIYNTEFIRSNEISFPCPNLTMGEDLLFLLKVGLKTDSCTCIDNAYYYYRQVEDSASHIYSEKYFDNVFLYIDQGIKLLNRRGIWDQGYYQWIGSRFRHLFSIIVSQFESMNPPEDAKKLFHSRIYHLLKQVVSNDKLPKEVVNNPIFTKFLSGEKPKISVVIPVYNVEKYLRECLDSICTQSLKEIEIICVNDGSTDSSLAILEDYAKQESRVKIISQKNAGLGAARNMGLSNAFGEFVYFVDSDDMLPQNALVKMYSSLKKEKLDVLFFSAKSFYETPELEQSHAHYKTYYTRKEFDVRNGQLLALNLQKEKSNFVSACCYCCRRKFLIENGIRFPEQCLYEDNAAFWQILLHANRAKSITDALFLRRVRQGSIMTQKKLGFRNFEGYAKVVSILEKSVQTAKKLSPEFVEILKWNAGAFGRTLVNFYQKISFEERALSRELLNGALRDAAWLNEVRKSIAEIDKKEGVGSLTDVAPLSKKLSDLAQPKQPIRENPCSSVGLSTSKSSKKLPRLLVRLGALFIWNKAARKRWREEHMDLTPRNGIDINANPELRRDSALKRFAVRVAALFIFSKSKRRAFRAQHLNLVPKDGVDVRALSPEERRIRKRKKRERNPLRRLFNALVPASRSKIAHTEKRLTRHMEWQTQQILSAVKAAQAQTERKLAEIQNAQVQLKNQHASLERGFIRERELAQKALTDSLMDSANTLGNEIAAVLKRQKALETAAIEGYTRAGKCQPNSLEFRTFGDLAHCIRKQLHKIPADADLVVGLPRSGMIPAYIIALFMNKKCCSLDEFLNGTAISHGNRPVSDIEPRKVLIVDDSCYSGRAMDLARERLKPIADKYEFVYTVVYGRTESLEKIDCCLEVVNGNRVWQWNYLNHAVAQTACFDMDGVLCVDPAPEENDDGVKYLNFIKTAAPLYIPSYKIRAIVTSRLEKYRSATEAWLREHGVQYDELVMLDLPTAEERRRQNCHATFKAEAYKNRKGTTLFVESEERQAKEIAFLTGKKVLCLATDELY